MTSRPDDTAPPAGAAWSVGDVAAFLELPASTVRTWERRYGLSPSVRTNGGHRRYDEHDVQRLQLMCQLVDQGVSPAEAARTVQLADRARADLPATLDDPAAWSKHVFDAAREFDVTALRGLFHDVVVGQGVADAWDTYLGPTLTCVGDEWERGDLGIDSEHLISEAMLTTLRARVQEIGGGSGRPVVIMASAEDDQHSLPVVALQAALAENGVEAHVFGQRLPAAALASVVARAQPKAVFLWASIPRTRGDRLDRVLTALAGKTRIVLGGPGWRTTSIQQARRVDSLSGALAVLLAEAHH